MKLKRLLSAMVLGGLISSSPVFAADSVTLSAGGPGAKETDYTINFVSTAGAVWTYSVYRESGSNARTLSHWSLGVGSCNVVSYTGNGGTTGNGGSETADGVLAGQPLIKWNTDVSDDSSNPTIFTFTLDGEYGSEQVAVVAKTGGRNKTDDGLITGPDCSNPLSSGSGDSGSGDSGSGDSGSGDSGSGDSGSGDSGSGDSGSGDSGSGDSGSGDSGSGDSGSGDSGSGDSGSGDSGSGDSGSGDSGSTACGTSGGDSTTLAAGGGDNAFGIEFLGTTGNTWSYKVTETGRALSHWSLGIENCQGHVTGSTGSHDNGGEVEQGSGGASDQLLKDSVDWMVKWDTDGGVGDGEIFTITLDGDYAAADIGVLVKTGGNPQSAVGTITAPNCAVSAPTDCSGDETDSGTEGSGDETDSGTEGSGDTTPEAVTCPAGTTMLGSFDWNGAGYILNGENVGGIAITGGVEGLSEAGANWAASAGVVSTILITGEASGITLTVPEVIEELSSGSFSSSSLAGDAADIISGLTTSIDSVMFCGTQGEKESLAVALPSQGSVVSRVWALSCEANCDEYLGAQEVALDNADHVLEVTQPNGEVLFIPISIMK